MGRGFIKESPTDELGGATGTAAEFTIQFVGKVSKPDYPYTVANECIAAALGAALGLPVAPGITDEVNGSSYFFSQKIRKHGSSQVGPPASTRELEAFVGANSLLVHGAIVFDLYIANNDRALAPERRNLGLDDDGRLFLYDHGNCCFYRHRRTSGIVAGVGRLDSLETSLDAMFDMDHKGNRYWELLTDVKSMDHWIDRIKQIPDFMIDAFVELIPPRVSPPTRLERDALAKFLKKRRYYLRDQILADKQHFPKLGGQA
ncbi:MAG: hypothetical protein H6841_00150 [Planctomycetes bacterium]|nr:hypothetical protein [Planctomycetota bacterium]